MVDQVRGIKLTTGEEIVASVVEEKFKKMTLDAGFGDASDLRPYEYVIRRPYVLRYQQVAPGQVGLTLIPWILSNPGIELVSVPAEFVLATFETSEQVETQYLQQTSGIVLSQH